MIIRLDTICHSLKAAAQLIKGWWLWHHLPRFSSPSVSLLMTALNIATHSLLWEARNEHFCSQMVQILTLRLMAKARIGNCFFKGYFKESCQDPEPALQVVRKSQSFYHASYCPNFLTIKRVPIGKPKIFVQPLWQDNGGLKFSYQLKGPIKSRLSLRAKTQWRQLYWLQHSASCSFSPIPLPAPLSQHRCQW